METQDSQQISYYRTSSDISSMLSIREKIQQLVELSIKIVIENDATPDIENEFEPVLRAIERSYPPFHKQGVHFFTTLCSMQETAKTNQLLSSAGVKIPLQNFTNDWKRLCSVIDRLSDLNPPPHAKGISSKFKAVRSSLDSIKKTNERRKQPAPNISNCITNILALGESVSKNIDELFSHNYSDFGSNLYESLRRDVKSFLTVINEAFSNEFVQSGVMLCDLYRIRSNIFTDCSEIVESLKSAFVFPKDMREIKDLKDQTEAELKRIVEKLSVQFVVIKPSQGDASSAISPSEEKRKILSDENSSILNETENNLNEIEGPIQNFLERDEVMPVKAPAQDYLVAVNRVDEFATKIFSLFDRKVDFARDTWDNLEAAVGLVAECVENVKNGEKKAARLRSQIEALEEKCRDNEEIFERRNEALVQANEMNKEKIERMQAQSKESDKKCMEMQIEIDKLRLKHSNLKARGDASLFRKALVEIGKMADPAAKIDFLNQTELIEKVKMMAKSAINRPCEKCPILSDELNRAKNDLISLIEKVNRLKEESIELEKTVRLEKDDVKEKKTASKKIGIFKSTSNLLYDGSKSPFLFTTQPSSHDKEEASCKLSKSNKLAKSQSRTSSFVVKVRSLSPIKSSQSSDNDLDLAKLNNTTSTSSIKSINNNQSNIKSPSNKAGSSCISNNTGARASGPTGSSNANNDETPIKIGENKEANCEEDTFEDIDWFADGKNAEFKPSASNAGTFGEHAPAVNSMCISDLIQKVGSILESRHSDFADLCREASISKQPVIDAIVMINKGRDTTELQAMLPSRLKAILHDLISDILSKSDQAKQAFKKREKQYVKTLFQIGEKLSKIAREDAPVADESQETSKERDRIIDQISSQIKTIRQNMSNLENDCSSQKKLNTDLKKQKDSIRLSFCSLFNFQPDDNDKDNIEKCRQILQKVKNEYVEKINKLNEKVDKLQSEAIAVEELINGASSEREGTIYEKLDKMHDRMERMSMKESQLEAVIASLKDALMNIASVLENRNDMDEEKSIAYINDFCTKYSGGVRVIDRPKFDLLFSKFDYNKNDSLYEILESVVSKRNR